MNEKPLIAVIIGHLIEKRREKTGLLPMRKHRRRSAVQSATPKTGFLASVLYLYIWHALCAKIKHKSRRLKRLS